ncbi:MAG TPA: MBL fold metallo-hydrolase [Bryobacteraceae bacterium]
MRVGMLAAWMIVAFTAAAQDPNLSITWVGQSCFAIRTVGGITVLTDPPAASVGYALPSLPVDVVTITHNHPDHNNSAGVTGPFTLVDGRPVTARREMTAAGLTFTLIPGFHDNQNGALRGPNTMIRWEQAGLKIGHLGDLGQDQLTDAQAADLQNLDILFIPAGGVLTITPERAVALVEQLRPRVAILMHYKTALGGPAQLAALPAAAAPFTPLVYKPSSVLVSNAGLPRSTEVWVMQPAADAVAVNSAGLTPGAPVAPGSLVSVFGNIALSQTVAMSGYPLPAKLGETEILIDGKAAPLSYVSPGQANLQVPFSQTPGQALLEARVAGNVVSRGVVTVVANAPGLFAVVNQDAKVNSPATPAHAGEVLQIFATGQGAVLPPVDDGAAAGSAPYSVSPVVPNVFLQGRQIATQFSGLAPGFAGLWQINAMLPDDAPTGPALSLVVVDGLSSNMLTVAVVVK